MALLVCKECKKEVSSTAQSCPHCGAVGEAYSSNGGCLSGCFKACAGVFALIVIGLILSASKDEPSSSTDKSDQARIAEIEAKAAKTLTVEKAPSVPKISPAPISTPMPEPILDLAKVSKTEWPREVALREAVTFTMAKKGAASLTTPMPAGAVVQVAASTKDVLLLSHRGYTVRVNPAATDVAERIRDARRAKQKAADEAKAAVAAREDPGPEPKLSVWDGSPPYYVKDYIKGQLRDPDSLKFAETYKPQVITREGQKMWRIIFKYRAKNGFGGYTLALGEVYIRNETVIGFTTLQ